MKIKIDREKCKALYIRSINIEVEYKLRNREIKRSDEEYDAGAGFDDTLKVDYHVLLIVSRVNR